MLLWGIICLRGMVRNVNDMFIVYKPGKLCDHLKERNHDNSSIQNSSLINVKTYKRNLKHTYYTIYQLEIPFQFQEVNQKHSKSTNKGLVSESGTGLSGDDEGKTEVTEDVTVTTRRSTFLLTKWYWYWYCHHSQVTLSHLDLLGWTLFLSLLHLFPVCWVIGSQFPQPTLNRIDLGPNI